MDASMIDLVYLDIKYPYTRRGDALGGGELVALGIIYHTTDRPTVDFAPEYLWVFTRSSNSILGWAS